MNKEKKREQNKRYYEKNKEREHERYKKWYEKNKEKRKQYNKQYRLARNNKVEDLQQRIDNAIEYIEKWLMPYDVMWGYDDARYILSILRDKDIEQIKKELSILRGKDNE